MAVLRMAVATRNAMLQKIKDLLDAGAGAGTLKLYSGSQPATGDTALSGNTLLGTLTFSKPSGSITGGVLTFDVITEDSSADATATATWGRIQDSAGNNVFDGDVGTSGAVINLNTTSIVTGGPIRITSFTVTAPATM